MKIDILLVCVGGQDVEPFKNFFTLFCKQKGFELFINYKKGFSKERCSETYSIRIGGGYGDITQGKADAVIALEQLEGVRYRRYVSEEGAMIMSSKRILPLSVLQGVAKYPENAYQKCLNDCFLIYPFDGAENAYFPCLLALRASKVEESDLFDFGKTTNLYTPEEVKRVFLTKPVRA